MKKIKTAVIGVGYLGKFHADKYATLANSELMAVCDIDPDTSDQIAHKHQVPAIYDYRELLGKVDAVSIAVPTHRHFDIGKAFLETGSHVLMEKPITSTLQEAKELTAIAQKHGRVLQIGHLERFNAVSIALKNHIHNPQFIESQRLSPFNPRGIDVNVVLDLMIHDIDLIQHIVKSDIVDIDAQGSPVLTQYIDIANARIKFANGCVANVTASRVSFKTERKMRIFQEDAYVSVDFQEQKYAIFQKGDGEMFPGIPDIKRNESSLTRSDALLLEIQSFLNAIETGKPPKVTGHDGTKALETATLITQKIRDQLVKRQPDRFAHLANNLNFAEVE